MKESFYFPHDNNAHNDPKLMTVFMKTGLAGVGLYWIIIELLHQQESGMITYDQYEDYIRWYSMREKGEPIAEQLLNIYITTELFCKNEKGFIYSKRVIENKKYREELSEKRSEAGKKSALARQKGTLVEQNGTNVEQGKERKGKERKLKTDTLVAMQPNEYTESISFLKKQTLDSIEIPEYAEKYRDDWIAFIAYWTEKGKTGKIRAEREPTFEIKRRFATWINRKKENYQKTQQPKRGVF